MQETQPVRAGEEIDVQALTNYLRPSLGIGSSSVQIKQFPAGSSNLTYLITINSAEYVLRRPPHGNTVRSAHDMSREFNVLSKLSAVYAPAPKPVLLCSDAAVIGSEFYLMERRSGLVIRGAVPRKLATDLEYPQAVCQAFIQNLADLHRLDYLAAGLGDLGHPAGYPRRQVDGWAKRYFAAKTHELPELEHVIEWLSANVPPESGAALIHNDYKFDNVMFDPNDMTRITAVLDWEMVTIGDPLMDLGTTLGYWMSPNAGDELLNMPFNPRVLMENITRQDLAEMYAATSGRDVSNILFYYVFGTFKIAVIAQQIYARFARGITKDPRFARFDAFVASLSRIASSAVESGKV